MANGKRDGLCATCDKSIWCPTWAEVKCLAYSKRIYETVENCPSYSKRSKNFKELKCQCEDCLNNLED